MLRVAFVTLFPEMVLGAMGHSMMRRAAETGAATFEAVNPREHVYDAHRKVDDRPYGGDRGMLIMAEPIAAALESLRLEEGAAVVFTDPCGTRFDQRAAADLAARREVVFVCGHYEGIDERAREALATHTYSIGDFVLTGGELPALVMADAAIRLLPGVLHSQQSLAQDAHNASLLSAPQYTRPEVWRGLEVPQVLRSGDHGAVARWQRRQALQRTRDLRPDLLARAALEEVDLRMLS